MTTDKIYEHQADDKPFRFNDDVAKVFPDMLRRSIPGYAASIEAIGSLAARYVEENTNCYDLGCSLGAATLAMRQGIRKPGCRIIAVDTAPAMIQRCREIVEADDRLSKPSTEVELIEADIRDININNASMAVINYTLQFLAIGDRDPLMQSICGGLNEGGLLVLSEKVVDENEKMERVLVDLHHEHKRRNNYSALEVSRKRAALENILIPETVNSHRSRLKAAGFSHTAVWLRYFNFVSIIAIK